MESYKIFPSLAPLPETSYLARHPPFLGGAKLTTWLGNGITSAEDFTRWAELRAEFDFLSLPFPTDALLLHHEQLAEKKKAKDKKEAEEKKKEAEEKKKQAEEKKKEAGVVIA